MWRITSKASKKDCPSNDRGIYIILVSFFIVVLLGLAALVFGLAAISIARSKMVGVSRSVSSAFLASYFSTPGSHFTKVAAASTRGEELLRENGNIPFIGGALQGLTSSPNLAGAGDFQFGVWYPEMPSSITQANAACGPSASLYPCFKPVTASNSVANAVQVNLHTQNRNPLVAPFAKVLGNDRFRISSSATAAAMQRCVAMILDVSMSTVQETHNFSSSTRYDYPSSAPHPTPYAVINNVTDPSMYAYYINSVPSITPPAIPGAPSACSSQANYDSAQDTYFCNQERFRNGASPPTTGPYTKHYLVDDYSLRWTDIIPPSGGQVWIDTFFDDYSTYFGPQPLTRFFLAMNVALRSMYQIQSPGDKAAVMAYTGDLVSAEPPPTPGQNQQLTQNIGYLIQLTNSRNAGWTNTSGAMVSPIVTPNFITKGWFPVYTADPLSGRTNLAQALWDSMTALSTCPNSAKKIIMIFSDGLTTCRFDSSAPNPSVDCNGTSIYLDYRQGTDTILNEIVPLLASRDIAVTTILDSPVVQPNIINVTSTPGHYLSPSEMADLGYHGMPQPTSSPGWDKLISNVDPQVVAADATAWADPNCTPSSSAGIVCPSSFNPTADPNDLNHLAFKNQNKTGYFFREPLGVWSQVAIDTGGIICNIMEPCPSNWYDMSQSPPEVRPTYRAGTQYLTCSPFLESKSEQAQKCALSAMGLDPIWFVEPPTPTP